MDETTEKISALLHEAGETHHTVYRITDGEDPDWASWYADWLIDHSELPDLLGVSYKAGVGDIRESPALKIIHLLRGLGAEVSYHDPHVPDLTDLEMSSVPLEESMAAADLVCILTAHPSLDYERVVDDSSLVLDFRGVTRGITSEKLVRL